MKALSSLCSILCMLLSGTAYAQKAVVDDFEGKQVWELKEWGDQAELSLSEKYASQGKKALGIRFTEKGRTQEDKGIVLRRSLVGRARDFQEFVVDLHNGTNQRIEMALGLENDQFYELPRTSLAPGWNKDVRFSLLGANFKAAKSQWQHKLRLDPDSDLGTLLVILYIGKIPAGEIHMDNLRSHHESETLAKRAPVAVPKHDVALKGLVGQVDKLALYELLELQVSFQGQYVDPYDQNEIALVGLFQSPSGKALTVEGFLYSGEVDGVEPVRRPVWKLRFTPNEVGKWSYTVQVKNRWSEARSAPFSVECVSGGGDGFVRVDRQNPHYFALDSGKFYYPLGQNVAWENIEKYPRYFEKMKKNQENWARIWMTNWSFGIEWKRMGGYKGLGNYNLDNAAKLDRLFHLADKNGIYLQLVFDFHGAYSRKVNPEWANNPFNAANGGFLNEPHEFFEDGRAKALYKKRLHYIVARYGHNVRLMAWEFMNEIFFTDNYDKDREFAWHKEMSEYLRSIDPYKHLITTSFFDGFNKQTYELSTFDFAQMHVYRQKVWKHFANTAPRMRTLGKPYFFAEFGSDSGNGVDDKDEKGVFLHGGLWASFMQLTAGNAMPWWWDTHIDPKDLYYHFGALARFAEGVDRRKYDFTPSRQRLKGLAGGKEVFLELMGLTDQAFSMYWICDAFGMHKKTRATPLTFEGAKVVLPSFRDGVYEVEFWDTYRGAVTGKTEVTAQGGELALSLPKFTNDLAFKITRKAS